MGNKSQGPYQHVPAEEKPAPQEVINEVLERIADAMKRIAKLEEEIKKCRR